MTDEKTLRLLARSGREREAYALRTGERIRERYSVSDELAILRQREEKPEEFAEYNAFAEACKAEAHKEVFGE